MLNQISKEHLQKANLSLTFTMPNYNVYHEHTFFDKEAVKPEIAFSINNLCNKIATVMEQLKILFNNSQK